ncbi:Arsenical pump-driving ATPase [Enhygromyxa salina]|uniref:arsenite-transporting ATPase n=1 Tax=Enhygromyxa salina TaxID=215803 RepID=A0A2S9XDQ6_9BACT|nr:ArsA-related P-loop ATPase [Enhygromyxa salina]PRP90995.1 Arsenical pump-driving ATPase [Enhygromyxa salina]
MPELRRSDPSRLLADLERRRLLIVSGKGGVGRTTVAALLGSALAARARKVLIATTGHDDRLAWMLGGEQLSDQPVEIAPGLEIQRLVPATCVEEYGALVTRSQRLSHMVFGNKVIRRLLRAIPGLDDFAILGKVWHEAVRARSYDTIVFDGPASGHLRLVLGVPQAILETVAEGPLTAEAEAMRNSLQDPSVCAAVLVGLPEPWPLTELGELATALRREIGMGAGTLVVNKLWPLLPPLPPREHDDAVSNMLAVVDRIGERGRDQREVVSAWLDERANTKLDEDLITVPWWPWGLEGPKQLRELLATIEAGGDAADAPR